MGDLNCDFMKSSDHKELKNTLKLNGMKQVISSPTRITNTSQTLIDIITTTHENHVHSHIVIGNSISDHDFTGNVRKIDCKKFKPKQIYSRNISKYNKDAFQRDLKNIKWDEITTYDEINLAWDCFKNKLARVIDKHAPMVKKSVRGRDCRWLNNSIRNMMNERNNLLKKARNTGKESEWSVYRKSRNKTTRMIKNSKANYNRSVFHENMKKPNKFWECIKRCYKVKEDSKSNQKSFKIDTESTNDKQKIANSFCKFFSTIGSKLQSSIASLSDKVWKHHDYNILKYKINPKNHRFIFRQITAEDVIKSVKKLNSSKSYGHDKIPASLINDGIN